MTDRKAVAASYDEVTSKILAKEKEQREQRQQYNGGEYRGRGGDRGRGRADGGYRGRGGNNYYNNEQQWQHDPSNNRGRGRGGGDYQQGHQSHYNNNTQHNGYVDRGGRGRGGERGRGRGGDLGDWRNDESAPQQGSSMHRGGERGRGRGAMPPTDDGSRGRGGFPRGGAPQPQGGDPGRVDRYQPVAGSTPPNASSNTMSRGRGRGGDRGRGGAPAAEQQQLPTRGRGGHPPEQTEGHQQPDGRRPHEEQQHHQRAEHTPRGGYGRGGHHQSHPQHHQAHHQAHHHPVRQDRSQEFQQHHYKRGYQGGHQQHYEGHKPHHAHHSQHHHHSHRPHHTQHHHHHSRHHHHHHQYQGHHRHHHHHPRGRGGKPYQKHAAAEEGHMPFRHFNNFCKKLLISTGLNHWGEIVGDHFGADESSEEKKEDAEDKSEAAEDKAEDDKKDVDSGRPPYVAVRVLDVASGRGGDIAKWIYSHRAPASPSQKSPAPESPIEADASSGAMPVVVGELHGYDISPGCVEAANDRAKNANVHFTGKNKADGDAKDDDADAKTEEEPTADDEDVFIAPPPYVTPPPATKVTYRVADCFDFLNFWDEAQASATVGSETSLASGMKGMPVPLSGVQGKYHLISVQFALHYGCDSLESLQGFFEGCSRTLHEGGIVFGTIVDAEMLSQRLREMYNKTQATLAEKKDDENEKQEDNKDGEKKEEETDDKEKKEENGAEKPEEKEKEVAKVNPYKLSNSLVTITVPEGKSLDQLATFSASPEENTILPLGFNYDFVLKGHVNADEFCVPMGTLEAVAAKAGFTVHAPMSWRLETNVADWMQNDKKKKSFGGASLSDDEQWLVSLYRSFAFVKNKSE